jgi:hypothetical protein
MEDQRSSGGVLRGVLLLLVLATYVFGLAIWTPLFLVWPRRYPEMTYAETVLTRWGLVRHIWTGLVRRAS